MQNQLERKEDEEEEAKYAVIEMFECHSFINKLNKDYILINLFAPIDSNHKHFLFCLMTPCIFKSLQIACSSNARSPQ